MTVSPDNQEGRRRTVADYMAMDDDERYELIDGELHVVPAPGDAHQRIVTRLGTFVDMHVMERDLGECRHAPFDVVLDDDTVVQPDFAYISADRVDEVLQKQGAFGAPDLVVEVVSSESARRDRIEKRTLYAGAGIEWFVVVSPEDRTVETFRLNDDGEYVHKGGAGGDDTLVIGCFPDLEIPLDRVWPPE